MSVETSRLAVKTVCKELYNHEVYLSATDEVANDFEGEPPSKKSCIPLTEFDYASYQYVLPSARTISDYKQMQASQVERDAALALLDKTAELKSTMHYDTTSRNAIDGEWPSIILIFSDGVEYVLRPLFFAYEDCEQITELFVETYSRLADAASVVKGKVITPASLWEKTNAIMTDAVSKNLHIEDYIGQAIGSDHRPHHLLCKSHTVEKLDASNLNVLSNVEKMVKQRDFFLPNWRPLHFSTIQ